MPAHNLTHSVNDDTLTQAFRAHVDALAARTYAALAAEGYSCCVIHSGSQRMAFLDDQPYAFRVNPHFNSWVPLNDATDCVLYFEPGEKPVLLFHQPHDFWYLPGSPPQAAWTQFFDVRVVADVAAARAALPPRRGRCAFIGESSDAAAELGLGLDAADINPRSLLDRLHYPRAAKSEYEIECMRRASLAGARGHVAARSAFERGASEFEIQLAFLEATGLREIELPYPAIVALNEKAATLHYQLLERARPAAHRSLLIDAGAHYAGYASDITRTYAGADPSGDFAALIARMEELQQSLCNAVRAGVDWRDLHLTAHRLIAELLRDADIIRIDGAEAVDEGLSSVFFPHGLGHLLGLQVHDAGGRLASPDGGEIAAPEGHPYLRLTRVLEEGFVVTMEPGIYFIDMLLKQARGGRHDTAINWPRVDALRPFGGIRIEDDLVVTTQGHENLTRAAFASIT